MNNLETTTKSKLEEIAIKIDVHSKVAVENILAAGKLLCDARIELPSDNEFGAWRKERLSWLSREMAYNCKMFIKITVICWSLIICDRLFYIN